MISVSQADELLKDNLIDLLIYDCKIEDSIGKVLKEDIFADREQPPFDRVTMDGIAINYESIINEKKSFKIQGVQGAGQHPMQLQDSNNCIEIMTGAVLAIGTNCVIKIEDIDIKDNIASIKENINLQMGMNIHTKGSDYSKDEILIKSGTIINSTHIAVFASIGKSLVKVSKSPKTAIVSTGDELIDLENKNIEPYQIRMSNSYVLKSVFKRLDFKDIEVFHLKDDYETLKSEFEKILDSFDLIVITGGVSAGKFDFIPQIMSDLNVKNIFHKIAQRPGKPLWFGKRNDNKTVFALPGNPVSVMICMYRYLIPFLKKSSVLRNINQSQALISKDFLNNKPLNFFPSVKIKNIDGFLYADIINSNNSGDFFSISYTDGFIELEKDREYKKGDLVSYYSWDI